MKEIIFEFWECSLKNDFSKFDWENAFSEYIPYLKRNCIEHGLGSFEEYLDSLDETYGLDNMEQELPEWVCSYEGNPYWYFSKREALEVLLKAQHESLRECYSTNIHGCNAKLLEKIENINYNSISESELITMFDECIHAEHCNGYIIEEDMDDLRKEFEENRDRFVTNIRDFL